MMHRWRMRLELEALVDGSLPEARRARLLRHLEQCAGCAVEVDRLTELDQVFQGACPRPVLQSPDASRELFLRALASAGIEPRPVRYRWGQWGWGALAAVVVGTVGIVSFRSGLLPAPARPDVSSRQPGPMLATQPVVKTPGLDRSIKPTFVGRRTASTPSSGSPRRRPRRKRAVLVAMRAPMRRPVPPSTVPPPAITKPVTAGEPVLSIELVAGQPPALLEVTTTKTGAETPGYARVAGLQVGPSGELVWSQTIVETGASAPQVALLPVSLHPDVQ